MYKTFNSLT